VTPAGAVRRAGPVLASLVAVAGCGSGGPPPRALDALRLARPPLADALAKQEAIARVAGGDLGPLLAKLRTTPTLSFPSVTRKGVTLRDVAVRRRGNRVAGEATVAEADLSHLAPAGVSLHYVPGPGPGIALKGSATFLGASVPVSARVLAENGAVVAEPQNLPVGRTVLFSDPRVHVDGVAARPLGAADVRVRAVATLR